MNEIEQAYQVASDPNDVVEYDLADAIYAACLADSLRSDSSFYFMDAEDGGSAMLFWAA